MYISESVWRLSFHQHDEAMMALQWGRSCRGRTGSEVKGGGFVERKGYRSGWLREDSCIAGDEKGQKTYLLSVVVLEAMQVGFVWLEARARIRMGGREGEG
jgi:hypothetical protein